jgi:hypothetical protein
MGLLSHIGLAAPGQKGGIAVPQKGKGLTCPDCSLGESRK